MVSLYITSQHVIEMSVPYQFPDLSRSFAHCMYEPRRSQSRCINRQKRMRPISSHLGRTSLGNKGFIIWPSGQFFPQNTASRPERARSIDKIVPYLVRSGSQSQCRVRFILRMKQTIWMLLKSDFRMCFYPNFISSDQRTVFHDFPS